MNDALTNMKLWLICAALGALLWDVTAKLSLPTVQVYSHYPGEYGKHNSLICHVSGFYPPNIQIDLIKNGAVIEDAYQTDLAFEQGWHFHITKSVPFQPQKGETYECKVTHMEKTNKFIWEPDM